MIKRRVFLFRQESNETLDLLDERINEEVWDSEMQPVKVSVAVGIDEHADTILIAVIGERDE